jgi:hypothetical protein
MHMHWHSVRGSLDGFSVAAVPEPRQRAEVKPDDEQPAQHAEAEGQDAQGLRQRSNDLG